MEKIILKRLKHVAKLEKLIKENAPFDLILQQSRIVDEYIELEMKA